MTSVLIVDDHPSFRACARLLLEAEGFEVAGEAADAAEALACVRELRPDVVLLDIQLPDEDGCSLARKLAPNGTPRVVLISSRDEYDYGADIRDCGACGFIAKGDLSGAALAALLA